MDEPALIDAYLTGIESLSPVVEGLSPEQLKSYPVPGTWSILEVVCHLADTEALFAERSLGLPVTKRGRGSFADRADSTPDDTHLARTAGRFLATSRRPQPRRREDARTVGQKGR
jgi:hypothetical protein